MAKTYKVWVEIEEFDEETGDGQTIDGPGSYVAAFATPEEAYEFAGRLQDIGENLPADEAIGRIRS